MILSTNVPAAWQSEFARYMRTLVMQLGTVGSLVAVLFLPLVQWIDASVTFAAEPGYARINLLCRLPSFVLAVGFLGLAMVRPKAGGLRLLLGLVSFSLVSHSVALAVIHNLSSTPGAEHSVNSLILVMLALSPAAIYGLRDVAWIQGIPVITGVMAVLLLAGEFDGDGSRLVYPAMALVISAAISELLYRGHVRTFLAQRQLREFAMTDPLTGLLNRRAMDHHLERETARSLRHQTGYAVVMMDLDHFKNVNDQYGHDVGDEVLRRVSIRMQENVRRDDYLARWGGEEFLLLLHASDATDARIVAEKIRTTICERPIRTSAGELSISISLGIAVHDGREPTERVIGRADEALYRAKGDGRNRVAISQA